MQRLNTRTLRIAASLFVLLILAVLGAWYVHMKSATAKIDVVSVSRGLSSVVPSFFGSVGSTESNISGILGFLTGEGGESASSTERAPRLWHVTETPVAGANFFSTGSTTVVRFIDRSTGHLLEANPSESSTKRITNTLIPHVYEAYFTSSSTVILQTLSESGAVLSVAASVQSAAGTETKLAGVSLPQNIRSLAVSPDRTQIFMLLPNSPEGSVGIISDTRGGSQKRIFSSGLSQWRVLWPERTRILLIQNASDGVPGSAFSLTPSGALSQVLQGLPGLSLVAGPFGERLYSTSDGQGLTLTSSISAEKKVSIDMQTVAEKCVVAGVTAYCAVPKTPPQGVFLRDWYRGSVHTEDALWRVTLATGARELLFDPSETRASVDAKNLFLSNDGEYLGFRDAGDGSLWMLRIKP